MAYTINTRHLDWNEGELKMQQLLPGPEKAINPTHVMLSTPAASLLTTAPLFAVGTVDSQGRPWSSLWGGSPGLSQPLGNSVVGIKTRIDKKYDPVVQALMDGKVDGELVRGEGAGKMMSGLPIDLASRRRQKLFGRKIAGAVKPGRDDDGNEIEGDAVGELQMAVRIDQSLGNCPKYLNSREITPAIPAGKLISDDATLPQEALDIIAQADMLFVSSADGDKDMDTNHRGGPPGFIRTKREADGSWYVIWPEYSGNGFYQTLGNLQLNPQAGLIIPDFETGDVVYLTGQTEILVGAQAAEVIARSFAAVRVRVTQAIVVLQGLPFRGELTERSPYNPKVRPLADEKITLDAGSADDTATALRLVSQEQLTPSISRFRFELEKAIPVWKPGQWVALDFSAELDTGWSHMRDEDPLALNDDHIRTFTVSSPPPLATATSTAVLEDAQAKEFEITIRLVGNVTRWLFRQHGRSHVDISMRGFGGSDHLRIKHSPDNLLPTGFIAAGIGITPLMGQLPFLDLSRLGVFWILRLEDIDLVADMLDRADEASKASNSNSSATSTIGLASTLNLFFTSPSPNMVEQKQPILDRLKREGAKIEMRRMKKDDLRADEFDTRWWCCVTPQLQSVLEGWLEVSSHSEAGSGSNGSSDGGATGQKRRELLAEEFY